MSSVRKKDQSPNRFTVLDRCLDLYEHTCVVIANPKFDECRSLKERIADESSLIYHYCRSANEDYDNRDQAGAKMRIDLQIKALERCRWLKTYIRLAQRRLHLRAKKCIFWNSLINKAEECIKAWNTSEKRLYKEKYGL